MVNIHETLTEIVNNAFTFIDDKISGDGGANTPLTDNQRERMEQDLKLIERTPDANPWL